MSKERVSIASENKVLMKLKNPYLDGTTHLSFTQEDFIKRLIALIPPSRQNLIRYFGVFGARHKKRAEITSKAKKVEYKEKKSKKISYYTPWADLLKRVFKFEVSCCDHCGHKLRLVSSVHSPKACEKIVSHLGIKQELPIENSHRGPPESNLEDDFLYEFNQEEGAW